MNSFGFSLDQEKSFPRRIGSVPRQEKLFPQALRALGNNYSVSGHSISTPKNNSWSCENPHKFMGPPTFFLVIISFPSQ